MRVVAVTGASGMVGRHVIDQLGRHKVRVRVLMRQHRVIGNEIEVVVGNLTSEEALSQLLDGADTVIHCAAELHDVSLMEEINVVATERLAKLSADRGVERFVHISSAGVIGPSAALWVNEESPCAPANDYEVSKCKAEQLLTQYHSEKMRICMLRPTNVIDDRAPGLLSNAIRNSWRDWLLCFLKGGECAHLVHAQDVAAAAVYLAGNEACEGAYFVGYDEDEENSVSGVFALARESQSGSNWCGIHLPVAVPYWMRCLVRGISLHGRTRFSSERLTTSGFIFQLGLQAAVKRVCSFQQGLK